MNKFPEILPAAGSRARPCAKDCTCKYCAYWRALEQRECSYCGLKLGESNTFYIFIWTETETVEHLQCQDEHIEMEAAALDAGCIDAVARKLKTTQSAVKEMPRYERHRLAAEHLDTSYPEWRAKIKAELAARRALSDLKVESCLLNVASFPHSPDSTLNAQRSTLNIQREQ